MLAYLAVVKGPVYGQVVHVRVQDGCHLRFLNGADLAMRVHDEHRHVLLPAQAVYSCRPRVSARSTDDGQVLPIPADLALVPAHEEVLEQVPQELQCDILERECWAVEELQQMYVLLLVEGHRRRDILGPECSVAPADDVLEVCGRDLSGRDVEGEDLVGEVFEGEVLPFRGPVAGERGDFFGDEQAAVGSKALEDDFLERELERSDVCCGRIGVHS